MNGFGSKLLVIALFTALLTGCSYGVQRNLTGTPLPATDSALCEVVIAKYTYPHTHFNEDQFVLIQTITLYDKTSINCSEDEARAILKKEACAVGGNWISITKERFPDLLSSCYQCEASIYFVQLDTAQMANSNYVTPTNPYADEIELATIKRQRGQVWGYFLGFALGFTLTLLLLQ